MTAVVRVDGGGARLAPLAIAARKIASRLAPTIPAPTLTTMSDAMVGTMGAERMMAVLAVFFAGCALLVTAIGLYGRLAYATARHTSEIKIRMALGAQRARVVLLIFKENAVVAIAGCGGGLITAVLASRCFYSSATRPIDRRRVVLPLVAHARAAVGSGRSSRWRA